MRNENFLYDGYSASELAEMFGLPHVELLEETTSTLDVAHHLSEDGADKSPTLILADTQTAGRGRGGNVWTSHPGRGIWLTLVVRPHDAESVNVLALRTGIQLARALDRFADEPIRLKWPNDLYVDHAKLAGILTEARWSGQKPEWVAIGVGINVIAPPDVPNAAALEMDTKRIDVLEDVIPALKEAAEATGPLQEWELEEFAARDMARGKKCVEPAHGIVKGISPNGELLIALADSEAHFSSGSLILEHQP